MTKKIYIRIILCAVAIVFLLTAIFYNDYRQIKLYKREIENEYSYALYELNTGLNNISVLLEKCKYVSGGEYFGEIATQLHSEALASKTALARLPLDNKSPDTLGRFLSQVGNYALFLSGNVISGNQIDEEQKQNLQQLSVVATTISTAFENAQMNYNNHDYWFSEIENILGEKEIDGENITSTIDKLEENLTDFPTLIYDGPFSEHLLNRKPKMLENAENKDQKSAEELVRSVAPQIGQLKVTDIPDGEIPVFRFDNEEMTFAVSKAGGYLVYFRSNRGVGEEKLNYTQAISKAKLFLNQLSLGEMTETYYFTDNNVCVINFAAVENSVICYPDLVKVGVALDTGEVVLYEAGGYLYNHTKRDIIENAIDLSAVRERIERNLKITSEKRVLIPSSFGTEIICYELLCIDENEKELLIYINSETLEEENILILLKTDGGILVK